MPTEVYYFEKKKGKETNPKLNNKYACVALCSCVISTALRTCSIDGLSCVQDVGHTVVPGAHKQINLFYVLAFLPG